LVTVIAATLPPRVSIVTGRASKPAARGDGEEATAHAAMAKAMAKVLLRTVIEGPFDSLGMSGGAGQQQRCRDRALAPRTMADAATHLANQGLPV
jgi:hypothetical protein